MGNERRRSNVDFGREEFKRGGRISSMCCFGFDSGVNEVDEGVSGVLIDEDPDEEDDSGCERSKAGNGV
jgi:hypothetical protein